MRRLLVTALACGALAILAKPTRADDDAWEDWEDAVEDAREDAEDEWEDARKRDRRRAPVHRGGWYYYPAPPPAYGGHYYRHGYPWGPGYGYPPSYGHWHYYGHRPGPVIGPQPPPVSTGPGARSRTDSRSQQQSRTPEEIEYGAPGLHDVAFYEGDAPVPKPMAVFVPPAPGEPHHGAGSRAGSPPPFAADRPRSPEPQNRLEPIPDEQFKRGR